MDTQKQSEETIISRLQWVTSNNFILKANYEWHCTTEKAMITQHLIEYSTDEDWDRLTDSFDYFFSNND